MPDARIGDHNFHYRIVENCLIIRPDGACNEKQTEALAELVNSEFAANNNLILDLSRAEYVDSPGFRWIVRQVRALESDGRRLVLTGMQPTVQRAYKLLRLDKIVPAFENVRDALENMNISAGNVA